MGDGTDASATVASGGTEEVNAGDYFFRPNQHAQGRRLAKPCHNAHRSAN
jgi:hypothetical protein